MVTESPIVPRLQPSSLLSAPHYRSLLAECVHCGLCLNNCPTYQVLGEEADSPRGRLHLMTSLADGRLTMTGGVRKHLDLCLQCRACETVCPAHVHFGTLMEIARDEAVSQLPMSRRQRLVRRVVFDELLPHPARLRAICTMARLYQRSGAQRTLGARGLLGWLARQAGPIGAIAARLADAEALMPRMPGRWFRGPERGVVPAIGPVRTRVAFVAGCVMSVAFADVNRATVRLARRLGAEVLIPPAATCCGALHAHAGERARAQDLARRNIAAFEASGALDSGCQAILVNAAGCGAMLKEYGELLRDDRAWADRAARFSARVRDVSEWLAGAIERDPPTRRLDARVVYQDACHLAHGQGVRRQPRDLLRAIPGLELVEAAASDRCCGSAGIYNLQHPEIAAQLAQEKVASLVRTGATIVASGNPGCLMQLRPGLDAHGIEALHTIELLDRAYQVEPRKGSVD